MILDMLFLPFSTCHMNSIPMYAIVAKHLKLVGGDSWVCGTEGGLQLSIRAIIGATSNVACCSRPTLALCWSSEKASGI